MEVSGAALAQAYFSQVVAPVLAARWPGLPVAAGRLGGGSDALGYDDAVSRDHDWGLRLNLLVPAELAADVDAVLEEELPETFQECPVRFATTWDPTVRHRVQVDDVDSLVRSRTGLDMSAPLATTDWLSLTGQSVLEVTAGPVFVDTASRLTEVRRRLEWYPEDLWRYVVAADWSRIAQELPFVGRTGERGDDLGSRVIASRLVAVCIHLAHLLERRWQPYPKWAGASLLQMPRAGAAAEPLRLALEAGDWTIRQERLADALRMLNGVQRQAGLPAADDPVQPFFERSGVGIRDEVVKVLEASIDDAEVRALPRGVGSAEQWSDNVDVLVDPTRRLTF
ncbi:MAG: DUF4037 domain-containing protein [Nocardioidaceae bacterium]